MVLGPVIRSKKRDTGRKTSLTDVEVPGSSNCWSTGSG
jgi:hypothetical protein